MNILNNFYTEGGAKFCFRRKHPAEAWAGIPGVFALTVVYDFEITALHFEATDDLACADVPAVQDHPKYLEGMEFGPVGVATCFMPDSGPEFREAAAKALNDTVESLSRTVEAA